MESATSVDPQALQAAANRLDAVADLLHGILATYLRALRFDADAGVRSALDAVVADVRQWQCTAADTASALRTAARRYVEADTRAAEALG